MCNIMIFHPGFCPPKEMLVNCVHNNPDGFGLILKDKKRKKLEVIRKLPVNGENNPEEIWNLIEENKDFERFLHVRHRTEGPINIENTHPFVSYSTGKREVLFMHNGTLHDYAPKKVTYINNVRQETDEDISDSKRFNDEFLTKFLLLSKGDISDPTVSTVISKFWGYAQHNRGLLVASDQDFLLINKANWELMKTAEGEFWSSNKTYFSDVIRGPEFERRKKAKEAEDAQRRPRFQDADLLAGFDSGTSWPLTPLKNIDFSQKAILKNEMSKLLLDHNIWDADGIVALSNLTDIELKTFAEKNPEDAAAYLGFVLDQFKELSERYDKASSYLDKINKKKQMEEEVMVG